MNKSDIKTEFPLEEVLNLDMKNHILFDFDGVLVCSHDSEFVGRPVDEMIDLVKYYINNSVPVRIFTARSHPANPNWEKDIKEVKDFCKKFFGKQLPVVCSKNPSTVKIYDDRAIQVRRNQGLLVT